MREITAQALSLEKFAPYGAFADMTAPSGEKFGASPIAFYRDMVQLPLGQATSASLSIVQTAARDMVVDVSEYHTNVGEGILPLDEDIIIHVAPATDTDTPPAGRIEAFIVPKGTLVVLRPGVWHHAPFTVSGKTANTLIILPERTYANDCIVRPLSPDNQVKIAL